MSAAELKSHAARPTSSTETRPTRHSNDSGDPTSTAATDVEHCADGAEKEKNGTETAETKEEGTDEISPVPNILHLFTLDPILKTFRKEIERR